MTLAQFLRANRGAASDLARKLGVSHSTVSRWASGQIEPPLSMLAEIERATSGAVTAADMVAAAEKR